MKKIFIVISILFLTAFIYSRELKIPNLSYEYEDAIEELNNSGLRHIEEYGMDEYYDMSLLTCLGKRVFRFYTKKINDETYMYMIVFKNLTTNEWTNLIFKFMKIFNTDILIVNDDLTMSKKYYDTFSYNLIFAEEETSDEGVVKSVAIVRQKK